MNILHRMILRELTKVFLLSLVSLTGLFLLAGLVHEASQRGLSPAQILAAIPLLIPTTLPYTIPATTLFATCVVYGRLAHDNEYTAVKAAGVNPLALLRPALALGLGTSSLTLTLYYDLIPRTQQMMKAAFLSNSEEVMYGLLKRERRLRFPDVPFVMFVREVQGRRLIDVIFKRRADMQRPWLGYDLVVRAREAKLRIDQAAGVGYIDMDRFVVYGERSETDGEFRHQSFQFPLPEALTGKEARARPSALTWEEMRARREELRHREAELAAELEAARRELAAARTGPQHEDRKLHAFHIENQLKDTQRNLRALETEMQMRPALAFGCLCFVLIGCPVGIRLSRADYLSAFVSCFLQVVCLYYPLVLCGGNLAREGTLPVVPAVWAADAVLVLAAAVLTWRLMRH